MQKTFEVNGPTGLDVRLASGEIEIETTDAPSVQVELIAHDEDSQQLVDTAQCTLEDRAGGGQRVVVDVPNRRSGGFSLGFLFGRQGITCRIRAPHGSPLAVRSKSADVSVHGTIGGSDIATASGDVELQRVDGDLSVKSASGDITAATVAGGVSVQTASGDVEISHARGTVEINSASGDVTIRAADGSVNVRTVSGDQEHGAVVSGTVAAHSVSGDVTIGVRRGAKVFLDCTTVSGATSSELSVSGDSPADDGPLLELRAKTVSGDIRITRAPALDQSASSDSTQEVHA